MRRREADVLSVLPVPAAAIRCAIADLACLPIRYRWLWPTPQSITHALLDNRCGLSDKEPLDELLYNPFDGDAGVDSSRKLVK